MKHPLRALLALTAAGLIGAAHAQTADDSLYRAWGQKAGIQAVMQDFVTRLVADARMAPFFKNTNRDNLVTQLTEQLCQQAGGPCVYKGVPMKEAHADMAIGRRDFNALVEVLQQSMDARGIPFDAQNAMLARLAPMHRDVITRD
ncbi:group I truncated hemoglobin [Roseateles sp. BYS87W]|uniref:Group 1 truncated hemoglobin n=1 Tax=Pelomonas baiyunensis TaxID=3299026 RepID=A0ABW7GT09_9BURK